MEIIRGKAKCVIVDDIDTDQIFHASLLTIHEPEKIKPHIFSNLKNYEQFGNENNEGRIVFVGKNFGKGSTRQQAVTGFIVHKIQAIVGISFGPIYYGNALNEGLLLIEAPDISNHSINDDDDIEIFLESSLLKNKTKNYEISIKKIPQPLLDIRKAGGLLELGKTWTN